MPLCGCSGSLSPSLSGREVLQLRATEFYYSHAQVWGRWATIGKWAEMKLNLGECRYFPFPHCCICKQWGTFQMGEWDWGWWSGCSSRVVCSQLLPTSVSAVVRSQLGLHRSWQCCSVKAQRWPELGKKGKKNVPQARLVPLPLRPALFPHEGKNKYGLSLIA